MITVLCRLFETLDRLHIFSCSPSYSVQVGHDIHLKMMFHVRFLGFLLDFFYLLLYFIHLTDKTIFKVCESKNLARLCRLSLLGFGCSTASSFHVPIKALTLVAIVEAVSFNTCSLYNQTQSINIYTYND